MSSEVPYQSLYRRYRPQHFSELFGQPHIALALKNAVKEGRVGHAYLFSGPRGTGKTSTARILAKALNCAAPAHGEPCGACDSCLAIALGNSFDVHELDAASNNSVDAMRDLVARAALATPGNWKVYIVDEVHMLSTAASNALLKTLEEPPGHVVFVLATTDPQKLLPTIRSRTQHFEFHLLGEPELSNLLEEVAKKAQLALPNGAISGAVRRAKGSARDALSVLDQIAAAGVLEQEDDHLGALVGALGAGGDGVLQVMDDAIASGRDPQQLAVELIERLRIGFLALARKDDAGASTGVVDPAELLVMREMGLAHLVRTMELLGSALVAMRDAPEPRITLEIALIRSSHPEAEISLEALLERIDRLESRVAQLSESVPPAVPLASQPTANEPPARAAKAEASPAGVRPSLGAFRREQSAPSQSPRALEGKTSGQTSEKSTLEQGASEDQAVGSDSVLLQAPSTFPSRDDLVQAWGDHILIALRPKVRAIYNVGRFVGSENGTALFALPNEVHVLHAEPLRSEVVTALSQHFSLPVDLRIVVEDLTAQERSQNPDEDGADRASAEKARGPRSPTANTASAGPVDDLGEIDDVAAPTEQREDAQHPGERAKAPEGTGLAWAEDSLLRAFPGAEEVGH